MYHRPIKSTKVQRITLTNTSIVSCPQPPFIKYPKHLRLSNKPSPYSITYNNYLHPSHETKKIKHAGVRGCNINSREGMAQDCRNVYKSVHVPLEETYARTAKINGIIGSTLSKYIALSTTR